MSLDKQLRALIAELQAPDAFLSAIGGTVKAQTEQRFTTKLGPLGGTWSPWTGAYAKTRTSADSLLIDMSTHKGGPHLKDSFEVHYAPHNVEVGTAVAYAQPNQNKRPYLGIGPADVPAITEAVRVELEAMVQRAAAAGAGADVGAEHVVISVVRGAA